MKAIQTLTQAIDQATGEGRRYTEWLNKDCQVFLSKKQVTDYTPTYGRLVKIEGEMLHLWTETGITTINANQIHQACLDGWIW
jgi:hypothetical protein